MSRGRKNLLDLKRVPEIFSEQTGISEKRIETVIGKLIDRTLAKAKKEQGKDGFETDSTVELIILQYAFALLEDLLADVSMEDIKDAKKFLNMPEKKLLN